MSDLAIQVEGLGKKYRLGANAQPYKTLRESLGSVAGVPLRWARHLVGQRAEAGSRGYRPEFWALHDVGFAVQHGEVLGIIGRNGAGKSTLLKLLSHITEPTTGEIAITGRVASLLEVGTGFHPELTGRENVFLNGAILGMARREIERKFDEIVAFAEVEKFIDTQVKHYSSGMYLRLAFSVAAHLEPEILIVDEVLAVGDMAFQRKCLGKMSEVSKDGRTVLFVSHNLAAVTNLCRRALLLEAGTVTIDAVAEETVTKYLIGNGQRSSYTITEKPEQKRAYFTEIRVENAAHPQSLELTRECGVRIVLTFAVTSRLQSCQVGVRLLREAGECVLTTTNMDVQGNRDVTYEAGTYMAECVLPSTFLRAGLYTINAYINVPNIEINDAVEGAVLFEVVDDDSIELKLSQPRFGTVIPILPWNVNARRDW